MRPAEKKLVEKRQEPRTRKRITCELVIDGKGSSGIVHDVSAAGLFVQTRARPEPGTQVSVVLRPEGTSDEVRFEASVARQRVVPTRLQASLPGGVGLEVEDPSEELQELLESFAARGGTSAAENDSAVRSYRVRVKQRGKPASKVINVRCETPQAARARALRQAGNDWTVTEVKEL